MATKRSCAILRTLWLFVLLACSTAAAESGIRKKSGPTQITPGNPPCNAERDTWFKIVIENVNYTCNEYVKLKMIRAMDEDLAGSIAPNFSPANGFQFLGFSSSEGGSLSSEFEIPDMEDETEATIFFAIKTKPAPHLDILDAICDFEFAEFAIRICDHDGGCDYGTSSDPGCWIGEAPTRTMKPAVRVDADKSFCPPPDTGTGSITGKVTRPGGLAAVNARVRAKRILDGFVGCGGAPESFNETTYTKSAPFADRGKYEITGLPFPPGEYEVTVRDSGKCDQAIVNIAPGGTAVQDFVLQNNCP